MTALAVPAITPGMAYEDAARLVLDYLSEHIPMGFWSVTRVQNGRQTYLTLGDNVYGLPEGGSHAWADSYCIHMEVGAAPSIAPDAQSVPVYAAAGVNEAVTIGAYMGAPIYEADGELFGAICGLDPQKQGQEVLAHQPLLQLLSTLLQMVLAADRARSAAEIATVTALTDAHRDVLTGLYNRRGWDALVAAEQARYSKFADPTVIAMVDLDQLKAVNDSPGGHAAGDEYIRNAGKALRAAVRAGDPVARLGGDEFGILMAGCQLSDVPDLSGRLFAMLDEARVAASVGWAPVTVLSGITGALARADQAMYEAKQRRREQRERGIAPGPVLVIAHIDDRPAQVFEDAPARVR